MSAAQIEIADADITAETTDAIVNAANENLAHGGGVAAVIARAAGPELERESRAVPRVPTGAAYPTTGGNLAARWVVHAVGPVWNGGHGEDALLAGACADAVRVAAEIGATSVSFPSISTGVFGFRSSGGADRGRRPARGARAASGGAATAIGRRSPRPSRSSVRPST